MYVQCNVRHMLEIYVLHHCVAPGELCLLVIQFTPGADTAATSTDLLPTYLIVCD